MCSAQKELVSRIQEINGSMQSNIRAATTASQGKDALVSGLGELVQGYGTFLDELRRAGTPKLKNGAKVVRLFKNSFTDARTLLAQAQEAANNLDTSDPGAFQTGISNAQTALREGGAKVEQTSRALDEAGRRDKKLNEALKECVR